MWHLAADLALDSNKDKNVCGLRRGQEREAVIKSCDSSRLKKFYLRWTGDRRFSDLPFTFPPSLDESVDQSKGTGVVYLRQRSFVIGSSNFIGGLFQNRNLQRLQYFPIWFTLYTMRLSKFFYHQILWLSMIQWWNDNNVSDSLRLRPATCTTAAWDYVDYVGSGWRKAFHPEPTSEENGPQNRVTPLLSVAIQIRLKHFQCFWTTSYFSAYPGLKLPRKNASQTLSIRPQNIIKFNWSHDCV